MRNFVRIASGSTAGVRNLLKVDQTFSCLLVRAAGKIQRPSALGTPTAVLCSTNGVFTRFETGGLGGFWSHLVVPIDGAFTRYVAWKNSLLRGFNGSRSSRFCCLIFMSQGKVIVQTHSQFGPQGRMDAARGVRLLRGERIRGPGYGDASEADGWCRSESNVGG